MKRAEVPQEYRRQLGPFVTDSVLKGRMLPPNEHNSDAILMNSLAGHTCVKTWVRKAFEDLKIRMASMKPDEIAQGRGDAAMKGTLEGMGLMLGQGFNYFQEAPGTKYPFFERDSTGKIVGIANMDSTRKLFKKEGLTNVIDEINSIYDHTSGCEFLEWLNYRLYSIYMTELIYKQGNYKPLVYWEELDYLTEEEETEDETDCETQEEDREEDADAGKPICCFCSAECLYYGNNPDPLAENGVCCDGCNEAVIFARMGMDKLARALLDKRITEKLVSDL
jgi:hypothetical protein